MWDLVDVKLSDMHPKANYETARTNLMASLRMPKEVATDYIALWEDIHKKKFEP